MTDQKGSIKNLEGKQRSAESSWYRRKFL